MKVEKNSIVVKFKDVMPGQAFEWCNCHYIKAEDTVVLKNGMSINTVGLNTGSYSRLDDDDEVILYENAKVVLE